MKLMLLFSLLISIPCYGISTNELLLGGSFAGFFIVLILFFLQILKAKKQKNFVESLQQRNDMLHLENQDKQRDNMTLEREIKKINNEMTELNAKENAVSEVYKHILQKSRQQYWTIDLEARFLACNECYLFGLQFSEKQAIGKKITELFGDAAILIEQVTLDCIEQKVSAVRKKIEIDSQMGKIWLDVEWFPVFEDGNFNSIIILLTDKTKDYENSTIQNTLYNTAAQAYLIVHNKDIVFANAKAEQITKYTIDQLNKFSVKRIISSYDKLEEIEEQNLISWNPDADPVYNIEIMNKDAERLTYPAIRKNIHYKGKASELLIIYDSVESKGSLQTVEEKIGVFKILIDSLTDAVLLVQDNVVLSFNARFAELFHFKPSQVNYKKWSYLEKEILLQNKITQEQIFSEAEMTAIITTKENTILQCTRNIITPYEVISIRDITTEYKEREVLEKQAKKAMNSSESKTEFLANMSHEIRTPINGILSVVSLMKNTTLTEQQNRYTELVKTSGNALLDLINDVLDLSKIEAGYLKLESIPFSIIDTLRQVTQLLEFKAHEKPVRFVSTIAPEVPDVVLGDPNRIRQIFTNLGNNAVKFTTDGLIGFQVGIDTLNEESCRLHCIVSDTGIGIRDENIDKIFNNFEQEEVSTTRKFGGTGLGLSITKHLIKKMNGDIWVESEYEVGTEFHFIVELKYKNNDSYQDLSEKVLAIQPRVCIAISNSLLRNSLMRGLQNFGVDVIEAEDFEELAERIQVAERDQFGIDFIFIDYQLENLDIAELEVMLKEHISMEKTKLILMTNLKEEQAHQNEIYNDVIIHPFSAMEMLYKILPIEQQNEIEAEAVEIAEEAVREETPVTLILAEDNLINQGIAVELIESLGHQVHAADDGYAVLQLLDNIQPDCILMDIHMPELDGLETTKIIREEFSTLPIIALTAETDETLLKECESVGMNSFLPKPIPLPELKKLLENVAENKPLHFEIEKEEVEDEENILLEIDIDYIKTTLGDDMKVIEKTMEMIAKRLPPSLRDIREAIREEDLEAIFKIAHSLKGFISYFHFDDISQLIKAFEKAGKEDSFEVAHQIWFDLEPLLKAFHKSVKNKLKEIKSI